MSNSPGYGEKPPLQGFRRSFTERPRQLSFHERAALDKSDADSGLLYQHPAVRIISFEPPLESVVSKSSETHADADYPIDTVETLPWRSRTEDLAAAGSMRIEKIQGSVNFLKCGHNFVHSILRNSQCWCVDGESKFVLRKGKFQYYRIELPKETDEDKEKVEELKTALATVLKFEKTPCPFKRGFQVDLPDDAITPRRKGKWKARDTGLLSSPDPSTPTVRKWRSSRPSMPYTPPSAFPDSFNKRRPSDLRIDSPTLPKAPPLERRSSVAERRAAFESIQSSSRPPSRPQTPASSTSSMSHEDPDVSDDASSNGEKTLAQPVIPENSQDERDQALGLTGPSIEVTEQPLEKGVSSTPESDEDIYSVSTLDDQLDLEQDKQSQAQEYAPGESGPSAKIDELGSDQGLKERQCVTNLPVIDAAETIDQEDPKDQTTEERKSLLDHPASPRVEDLASTDPVANEQSLTEQDLQRTPQDDAVIAEDLGNEKDDARSVASTTNSFHTTDSAEDPSIDTDPTLTAESFVALGATQFSHKRDASEITVTGSTFSGHNNGEAPSTPRLLQSSMSDESWPDVQTPSTNDLEGMRRRIRPDRSRSPLPSSTNIVSPASTRETTTQFTASIIQKAATMAIVKPVEVVVLVLHVLARIAGGATLNDLLNGGLFQPPQRTRRHTRNPSFPDRVVVHSSDDEDDFGVPIRGRTRSPESANVHKSRPAPIKEERERESDVDSLFADDLD